MIFDENGNCTNCGEKIEEGFNACWKCEGDKVSTSEDHLRIPEKKECGFCCWFVIILILGTFLKGAGLWF